MYGTSDRTGFPMSAFSSDWFYEEKKSQSTSFLFENVLIQSTYLLYDHLKTGVNLGVYSYATSMEGTPRANESRKCNPKEVIRPEVGNQKRWKDTGLSWFLSHACDLCPEASLTHRAGYDPKRAFAVWAEAQPCSSKLCTGAATKLQI